MAVALSYDDEWFRRQPTSSSAVIIIKGGELCLNPTDCPTVDHGKVLAVGEKRM